MNFRAQLLHFSYAYGISLRELSMHLTGGPTRAYEYVSGTIEPRRATRQRWRRFKIPDKVSRRMVCRLTLLALMGVALSRSSSYAQPRSQSSASQAADEVDDHFFRLSLDNLHDDETNSIGIDYTPEARCSDNNWSTKTPVACNPQLSFMCRGNNPLSTCPASCQKCYNDDLKNLKDSLDVSTITSYQPNYYILTTAQKLKMKVLQGLYNDPLLRAR